MEASRLRPAASRGNLHGTSGPFPRRIGAEGFSRGILFRAVRKTDGKATDYQAFAEATAPVLRRTRRGAADGGAVHRLHVLLQFPDSVVELLCVADRRRPGVRADRRDLPSDRLRTREGRTNPLARLHSGWIRG